MPELACGCEAGWARCAEGLRLLQRKNELEQKWRDAWKNDDWWRERLAWRDYAQAMRRLARHLRAREIQTGRYVVFHDSGSDGYTSHNWCLMGRADSVERLTEIYQQALGLWQTAEIMVAKQLDVKVVQALQLQVLDNEEDESAIAEKIAALK